LQPLRPSGAGHREEVSPRSPEENTAADQLELSSEQVERLNSLTPAAGERHDEANMATVDR
jgi:hypothetical protein